MGSTEGRAELPNWESTHTPVVRVERMEYIVVVGVEYIKVIDDEDRQCAGPKGTGGVSSTYWNLGGICGAYRTRHAGFSLE